MAFEAIHSLVARTIAQYPDQAAIEGRGALLTYAELDARADDIAVSLQDAGAVPGSLIPVLAPERHELTAALLGVLRIGGVVVPLDPAAPPLLLQQATADVTPELVLVGTGTDATAAQVLGVAAPQAVAVHIAETAGASACGGPLLHPSSPEDPCYVFSTSGSTGRPKGILGRLGSIDHYIRWEVELLDIGPGCRVSQLTSPAFDAMLRDLFVPLITGGTICVPPSGALLDPPELRRWIDEESINLVHTVPSVFRGLLDAPAGGRREFASLRCVALSGEKLPPADARRWLDSFGGRVPLLNLYGPSETTMTKTYHFVTAADLDRPSIPIGRPMPGTEVLLLDEHGRATAPGAVGQIHLRTIFRSLGYHRLPDATASAFVPDPDSADPRDVLYRTGDFGRLLPDGLLEFLGRSDRQVKVGGVRVELGGVEEVLCEHSAVGAAAVVLAGADDPRGAPPHLRAYVELTGSATDAELREHVRDRLPDSAVPATVTVLFALPRTISGKIDRRALPAPVPVVAVVGATAPRTATEQAVGRIWGEVLPGVGVDVHLGFFDAGGRSLHVIELLSRIEAEFGAGVALSAFLAGPTVASLASAVELVLLDGGSVVEDIDLDIDLDLDLDLDAPENGSRR